MNDPNGGLHFGSTIASVNELRAMFPAGGSEHLLMLPHNVSLGPSWPFARTGIWSRPDSPDDLEPLFHAMIRERNWQEYETERKSDELRDTCGVHHFHLESKRKNRPRSKYRWFAFRDPLRFGNVWFNLGGTREDLANLGPLWTSSEWMTQIKELYPWVAEKYRIRSNPGIPPPVQSPNTVRHIWHREPDCYPVVQVGNAVYVSAGGHARDLDLDRCAHLDEWVVFFTRQGMFAKFVVDPEDILDQLSDAARIADRLEKVRP